MQKYVNLVDLVKSFRTDSYSNEYLLAKIGVDTAENEPLKVWRKIQVIFHSPPYRRLHEGQRGLRGDPGRRPRLRAARPFPQRGPEGVQCILHLFAVLCTISEIL